MGGAGTAAIKDDGVVQHAALVVLELIHALQEVGHLLAQEAVVFREFEHPRFVTFVGEIVVGVLQAKFEREGIADPHAVLAVQEESDAARDVGIEGQRYEIEDGAIVSGGILIRRCVELKV